jgi:GNAT superfamily N-acetyltransferase
MQIVDAPHSTSPTSRARTVTVSIRQATRGDVPRLVEMNHAAYPDLVGEGVVWEAAQLRDHLTTFPRGQKVATIDGVIVGAFSTFITPRDLDPLAAHTWLGITGGGYFVGHDLFGDTLYLADIYVDPAHWGRGVGAALYAALFELCDALELRRVVAGGRLWGFHEHSDVMSPEEYVRRVVARELDDRVLRSQLKAGFAVRGILPGYLLDPRSKDYATLLEWQSPRWSRRSGVRAR